MCTKLAKIGNAAGLYSIIIVFRLFDCPIYSKWGNGSSEKQYNGRVGKQSRADADKNQKKRMCRFNTSSCFGLFKFNIQSTKG